MNLNVELAGLVLRAKSNIQSSREHAGHYSNKKPQ